MNCLFIHDLHIFCNEYVRLVEFRNNILSSLRPSHPTESSISVDPHQQSIDPHQRLIDPLNDVVQTHTY